MGALLGLGSERNMGACFRAGIRRDFALEVHSGIERKIRIQCGESLGLFCHPVYIFWCQLLPGRFTFVCSRGRVGRIAALVGHHSAAIFHSYFGRFLARPIFSYIIKT